jgi:hypothetical protein
VILVVTYMTKRDQRRSISRRRDVILGPQPTYRGRFKGLRLVVDGQAIVELACSHMHKTKAAAERCSLSARNHSESLPDVTPPEDHDQKGEAP